MCRIFAGWFQPSPALQSLCPAPTASAEPAAAQPFLLSYPSWFLPLERSWAVQQCAKSQRWALSHGTTNSTDGVWRQCLVAAFPALVCLAPQLAILILFYQNRITSTFLPKWSGIIDKSAGRELVSKLQCLLARGLECWWWKAHLCVHVGQCQGIGLCSQLGLEQPWISQDCCTPLQHWPRLTQGTALALLGSQPLPFEASPAIPPGCHSHGSPWLLNWLKSFSIQIFCPIEPGFAVFLLKPWFYNIFTCGIPTEMDMDKSALSSCFSDSAWSTTKYRKHISTEEMVLGFFFMKKNNHLSTLLVFSQ